ncbi:winged helix-turn-helix domain-containing protein [Alteripontixanthobacter maritimus]|nr:winged helix-turn-helix domain-containing protein [Alteripontixanthobacter maritimus]
MQKKGDGHPAALGRAEDESERARLPAMLPRRYLAGPLLLDLFHRDARSAERWLGLHPREFAVLWRLAETPFCFVTRGNLLRDVWRLRHDPETNRVAVHIARLRRKLNVSGLDWLIETGREGGYRLAAQSAPWFGGYSGWLDSEGRAGQDGHHSKSGSTGPGQGVAQHNERVCE